MTYDKLYTLLVADLITRGQEENEAAKAIYKTVLDVLWPEIEKVQESIAYLKEEWNEIDEDYMFPDELDNLMLAVINLVKTS